MVTESDEGLACVWVFGVVSAFSAAQRGYACINTAWGVRHPGTRAADGEIAECAR